MQHIAPDPVQGKHMQMFCMVNEWLQLVDEPKRLSCNICPYSHLAVRIPK